ncbi:outer membrane beta-barrel protein [Bacteroides caccae]|jgi:long-subunit fatty acid transport protein|uniref:outer membrane beta-barrel protein n=1 Tax=Bacteroides caccae TaxID=47678 RepID=UPI0029102796|nr:outer membrane beta-barrel protein [Bacteroides caccae]MDU3629034.1 outer membrane beta-barrel protein [Bacteroides caccae]MDU3672259.1 outer membrane beta-barrel protein [Bacteroides caccae]
MKKIIILSLCLAAFAVSVKAQVYLGGSFGITHDGDMDATSFTLAPEVGYKLNDTWHFGLEIGYSHSSKDKKYGDLDVNAFHFAPYARWNYFQNGILHLFLEGGIGISTYKVEDHDNNNGFEIGVKPGIALDVTKHLSFTTKLGFWGYRDEYKYGNSVSGLSVSTEDLSIGLVYSF